MMTDREIQDLIKSRKEIKESAPAKGYKDDTTHKRRNLILQSSAEDGKEFSVFIRQHNIFIENFSIGLRYKITDTALGSVILVRYNGSHGETSRSKDGHYNQPHIHRISATEMQSGSMYPQAHHREITDRYSTFEDAIRVFFDDMGVTNWQQYFPELHQRELFHGS